MRRSYGKKIDEVIEDLSSFLKRDFSSRFRDLNEKEDRQLFYLAGLLTKLKLISEEIKEEKVLLFPKIKEEKIEAKV